MGKSTRQILTLTLLSIILYLFAHMMNQEKKYIKSINCSQVGKIMEIDDISKEKFQSFHDKNYQENKLEYLKNQVKLTELANANTIRGRIQEFTSVSHHIWITDITNPRDIVTYESAEMREGKYKPKNIKANIDHPDNALIQSIINLEEGAKESKLSLSDDKFYHILWTNFSKQDLIDHPELHNLRKLVSLEEAQIKLPHFIMININDLMKGELQQALPQTILNGLDKLKQDLISVKSQIEKMMIEKKYAGVSDVLRVAVTKDIGGIYFDLDYNLFNQEQVHITQKKYNLFDLMKNYETIAGKETSHNNRLCNAFISTYKPGSVILETTWNIIKRNITTPNKVDYIKYSAHEAEKIILQTGPMPLTIGFVKAETDKDIAVDFGGLIFWDGNKKQAPYNVEMSGSVGALGYDSWGGSWRDDYKSPWYVYYDTESGQGLTKAEWQAIQEQSTTQ